MDCILALLGQGSGGCAGGQEALAAVRQQLACRSRQGGVCRGVPANNSNNSALPLGWALSRDWGEGWDHPAFVGGGLVQKPSVPPLGAEQASSPFPALHLAPPQ